MPSLPRMALPLVISFTTRFLFSMVDMAYAAALGDDNAAVAAISFYIPFQSFYIAIWVGLSAGFTASLSSAFGHRSEERVTRLKGAMRRFLMLLVPCLVLVGIAVHFAVPHFGLEPDVAAAFGLYATTVMIGMPLTGFWSIYPDSIVKAHHDTRSTMIAGLGSTASNLTLNTVFVFVFGWGLFGIALATVLSRLTGLLYALHRARLLERTRRAAAWQPSPRIWPRPLSAILLLAIPGALTYLLTALEGSVMNALLTGLPDSTTAIASYGVYNQILSFALMPAIAISVAVVPFAARLLPQGHAAEVRRDLGRVLLMACGLAAFTTLLAGWLFADPIAGFFVKKAAGSGATTPPLTRDALRLLPLGALCVIPFLILRPLFEAALRPRLGILVSMMRFCVFSIPLLLLGREFALRSGLSGLLGLIIGLSAAAMLSSALTFCMARRLLTAASAASGHPPSSRSPATPPA